MEPIDRYLQKMDDWWKERHDAIKKSLEKDQNQETFFDNGNRARPWNLQLKIKSIIGRE